jgi:hypothetical protein
MKESFIKMIFKDKANLFPKKEDICKDNLKTINRKEKVNKYFIMDNITKEN